ncbi:hypothetical protein RND71_038234 [Anisodus tanguticus]|uniref:Uncharacterized protein n=1 Tax=Anisodus tanguticus TaxID=243964 RepID=A0AAE1QZK3_9SOLA|nr:hypothetical protein RND71_038234 [Anisodus tanguticus]
MDPKNLRKLIEVQSKLKTRVETTPIPPMEQCRPLEIGGSSNQLMQTKAVVESGSSSSVLRTLILPSDQVVTLSNTLVSMIPVIGGVAEQVPDLDDAEKLTKTWTNLFSGNRCAENCMIISYIPPMIVNGTVKVQLEQAEVYKEIETWSMR